MSTIPIEVTISSEQLLQAVERLPGGELNRFVAQVLTLQARRAAGALSKAESDLLVEINASWPLATQQRYEQLVARREEESITPDELQELIVLTELDEQHAVARLRALADLATLRGVTLAALMASLGLPATSYA
jgi:hypothetical protein